MQQTFSKLQSALSGPPTVISASPASGVGSAQTFAVTAADSSGASAIGIVSLLVNSALSGANACYVEFNRGANTFRLVNDAGIAFLGPIALGSASALSNSQYTVSAAGTSASTAGNTLADTSKASRCCAWRSRASRDCCLQVLALVPKTIAELRRARLAA